MTKGGTGDVLAGLIAALATKNDIFLLLRQVHISIKRPENHWRKELALLSMLRILQMRFPKIMKKVCLVSVCLFSGNNQ